MFFFYDRITLLGVSQTLFPRLFSSGAQDEGIRTETLAVLQTFKRYKGLFRYQSFGCMILLKFCISMESFVIIDLMLSVYHREVTVFQWLD